MKSIVFALTLLGAAGSVGQEPVSPEPEALPLSITFAMGQYAGPAAGMATDQYGTYPEFSDARAGISKEMSASLTGLLEDRLATDLETNSSSQMQRSTES
jgi:hypothetical protein